MDVSNITLSTTKDYFFTSIGIFGTFLKINGVNLDQKPSSKCENLLIKLCSWFWILVSIQNYAYLLILRSVFAAMTCLIASNENSSGSQLMSEMIFVIRQLGVPFFKFTTHLMLYITIKSTMRSFWDALKPVNRLLSRQEFSSIRKGSIFALIWIVIVVGLLLNTPSCYWIVV